MRQLEFDDGTAVGVRSHFLATVAPDISSAAAKTAQDDADLGARIRPF